MKPSVLIAIKSCWPYFDRRDACRQTWLQDLRFPWWASYTFIVGKHKPLRPFADPLASLYGEPDVLAFPCNDTFHNIAPKIKHIMRWALDEGYEKVVVADDDTFFAMDRLEKLVETVHPNEYVGYMRSDAGLWGPKPYMQGSAYVVGRDVMHILADSAALGDGIPDDVAVGQVLSGLTDIPVTFRDEKNFWPGPLHIQIHSSNPFISTHKCTPHNMRLVSQRWKECVNCAS